MARYTPVLHSVSYAGAWPGHSLLGVDAFLDKAVELGFRSIALVAKRPHVSPHDFDSDARLRLRDRIQRLGLDLVALMGYTDFTCASDRPGIPSAEMNAGYVAMLSKLAADLGAARLRIFTGYERTTVGYDAQYSELVKGLRLSADRAAEHGVTLMLQNHHDLASHHAQFRWLMEEVGHPNLRAAFDAWAPFLQGVSGVQLRDAVVSLAPWLEFTTVADYQVQPRFSYAPDVVNYRASNPPLVRAVACGDGEVDYDSFFAGLEKARYSGCVAYEMCAVLQGGGSLDNLDRTARRFLEWLAAREERSTAASL